MRLRYIYRLAAVALLGVTTTQCSSDNEEEELLPTYKTFTYYSYDANEILSGDELGSTADAFTPYIISHLGDTLFVANSGSDGPALSLYDINGKREIATIKSWQFNNEEKNFGSAIEGITTSGGRLVVSERESRIHVFSLPDLKYISCIGDGNWSGQVFQSQAIYANDSLLFSRDKNSVISIYKLADATAANYQNVKRWKQAAGIGMSNNAFKTHCMVPDEDGDLFLTDYEGKVIRALTLSKVSNDMKSGESIDNEEKQITTDFKPLNIALTSGYLYVTADDNKIHVYDREAKKWSTPISTVRGFDFGQPTGITAINDSTLYVSDMKSGKNKTVRVTVHKHEIREW
jgi:hypothetical protein